MTPALKRAIELRRLVRQAFLVDWTPTMRATRELVWEAEKAVASLTHEEFNAYYEWAIKPDRMFN